MRRDHRQILLCEQQFKSAILRRMTILLLLHFALTGKIGLASSSYHTIMASCNQSVCSRFDSWRFHKQKGTGRGFTSLDGNLPVLFPEAFVFNALSRRNRSDVYMAPCKYKRNG